MKKYIIFLFYLSILSITALAQIPKMPKSLLSPNAMSLGLYGDIPVSNFTGTPDISIPLYNIEMDNFELPISIRYHASGVRPDQHPGWVGLNWDLNIGGAISRVVKGKPDDLNIKISDLAECGYYFNTNVFNTTSWNQLSYLQNIAESRGNQDFEPDEFTFDFLNYHGKFLLDSDKNWIVQSDKPIKVDFSGNFIKIPFDKSNTIYQYGGFSPAFEGFTLTVEDGTKYEFGKNENAIEYSINFFKQSTSHWTATTWYLTKIILTNGQEINYTYTRRNFINQMCISLFDDLGSYSYGPGGLNPECSSSSHTSTEASYQGFLISPSYLQQIKFPEGTINCTIDTAFQLSYDRSVYDFQYINWRRGHQYNFLKYLANDFLDENYPNSLNNLVWYKLIGLSLRNNKGKLIKNYTFSYNDSKTERLMLKSILEFVWGLNGKKYTMEYNEPKMLPKYLAGKVDHWGYFNDRLISDDYATHYDSREPNELTTGYGVLSKIVYPTGGYTRFVFEPHNYRKQVKRNRWEGCEETFTSKIAGGLRIKKIINSATGKSSDEIVDKEYYYTTDYLKNKEKSFASSGILGGQFQYYFSDYKVHGYGADKSMERIIRRFSSQSVLPACINSTDCHIGYSEVIERRPDKSFTRYQYTNFDNGHLDLPAEAVYYENRSPYEPYASRAFERGHLLNTEKYNDKEVLKSSMQIIYERSPESFVKSMKTSLEAICPNSVIGYADGTTYKVFLYNYRIKKVIETSYDNPLHPMTDFTEYVYDQDGLVKQKSQSVNSGIMKTTYKRARDYSTPISASMISNHVLSPIWEEKEIFIQDNNDSTEVKEIVYTYNSLSSVSNACFPCINVNLRLGGGQSKNIYSCWDFDDRAHPIYTTEKEEKTVYIWSYNYSCLIAIVKGASLEEVERIIPLSNFMESKQPDLSMLDLLRASLPKAQIVSCTYEPFVGITSITDSKGVSKYYEYDILQRLIKEKNNEGKVEKKYDYQYQIK